MFLRLSSAEGLRLSVVSYSETGPFVPWFLMVHNSFTKVHNLFTEARTFVMKRKKLELTITIIIYFAAALLSGFLAIGVLQGVQKLTTTFLNENILVAAIFPLLTAEIFAMVFTLYDGRYAFQHMSFISCAVRAIKSTAVVAGIWAGILLIEKNSITESRYYFVTALILNAIFLTLGLYYAQRYTIEHFYKTDSASICAIMTTRERAPLITDLLKKTGRSEWKLWLFWGRKLQFLQILSRRR